MIIVDFANKFLNKINIAFVRYPAEDIKRRMALLKHYQINKIFDVGANIGEYGRDMRKLGFGGEIVSFEPLSKTFDILKHNSKNDKKLKAVNIALGSRDEKTYINIAGNVNSSSLLEMLPNHLESSPESRYIGKEEITVRKLDSIFNDYYKDDDQIYLKIDAQGFEKQILDGAIASMSKIKGIQVEMSLIPLYDGGILYREMIDFLQSNGFELMSLENGFSNPNTGQLLQIDGIFFRK